MAGRCPRFNPEFNNCRYEVNCSQTTGSKWPVRLAYGDKQFDTLNVADGAMGNVIGQYISFVQEYYLVRQECYKCGCCGKTSVNNLTAKINLH